MRRDPPRRRDGVVAVVGRRAHASVGHDPGSSARHWLRLAHASGVHRVRGRFARGRVGASTPSPSARRRRAAVIVARRSRWWFRSCDVRPVCPARTTSPRRATNASAAMLAGLPSDREHRHSLIDVGRRSPSSRPCSTPSRRSSASSAWSPRAIADARRRRRHRRCWRWRASLVGAAFLGSVTDAMLLGHWYLVQPGLPRAPLFELNNWVARIWPFEVALLLLPTGMFSVFSGSIDDGYGGMLGWFWIACAVTTIVLCAVTNAALKERSYSAVMAATGLLYLAILTAFGTDLVARAVLGVVVSGYVIPMSHPLRRLPVMRIEVFLDEAASAVALRSEVVRGLTSSPKTLVAHVVLRRAGLRALRRDHPAGRVLPLPGRALDPRRPRRRTSIAATEPTRWSSSVRARRRRPGFLLDAMTDAARRTCPSTWPSRRCGRGRGARWQSTPASTCTAIVGDFDARPRPYPAGGTPADRAARQHDRQLRA